MSGNRTGGLKTAATIRERHGEDFYARIARKGRNRSPWSQPKQGAQKPETAIN